MTMLRASLLSLFLLLSPGQARFYESHEKPGEVDVSQRWNPDEMTENASCLLTYLSFGCF
jgi:hypothetical protein